MTNPSGFEYRDDSIVARIAVDVPAATLTDLDQVRERAASLRTELEAIARAGGDWLASLQQIPQITEQANQAYRNMITQMERMSYIQQEMGGSQANVGMSGAPMGGQAGGAAPYSSAAPSGYVDPFMGMPGTGVGMGMQGAQTYMQSMMMNDPRMFANMAAQRGYPINPAQLGLVGGAVAAQQGAAPHTGGGMGQGASPPGSMSSQETQAARRSSAQPDPNNGGAPASSEPQRDPATPHPDTPAWQQTLNTIAGTAGSVLNETRSGMSGRGGGLIAGGAAALGAIGRIGGGGGGGGDDGGGGTGGGSGGASGGMGNWGRVAAGAGIAAAGIGLGVKGMNKIQDAGEQIQAYHNLGAQTGGGAVEGAGFEMQARMMALNPFITLDQSRSIMQSALKNGYTGKEFDTVTGFMADNLKEMNMSSSDSMEIFQSIVEKGHGTLNDFSDAMSDIMGYTGVDGNKMGLEQRIQQFKDLTSTGAALGMGGASNARMATSVNEAFSDNQILKGAVPGSTSSMMNNPMFQMTMADANGMKNISDPIEVQMRMEEQGVDEGEAIEKTYQRFIEMAYANSGGDLIQGAVAFYHLQQQAGGTLTPGEAKEMYKQFTGGNSNPFTKGTDIKTAKANSQQGNGIGKQLGNLAAPLKAIPNAIWGSAKNLFGNANGGLESFAAIPGDFGQFGDQVSSYFTGQQDIAGDAAAATSERQNRPASGTQMVQQPQFSTEGRVSGDLRITVDQQGRVTAPQNVTISGSQRGINAGMGSGTMNNPGPGDPAYQHSMPAFSGGGG